MANRTFNLRGAHLQAAPPGTVIGAYETGKFQAEDSGAVDANGDLTLDLTDGKRYTLRKVTKKVVSISVDATAGDWTLSVDGVALASPVAFNVAAATLQTAVEAIAGVGTGNATVTGGPGAAGGGTPYVITFTEDLAGEDPQVTAASSTLTGGAATATPTVTTQPSRINDNVFLRVRSTDPAAPAAGRPTTRRASPTAGTDPPSYNPGV